MRKDSGQIEAGAIIPLLAIIALTAFGGFLVAHASLKVSLVAGLIIVLIITSFLSAEFALYFLIVSMLLSPEFIVGGLAGTGTSAERGITLRLDDVLLVVIGLGWFLKTAIQKDLGLFLRTPLNRPIAFYIMACIVSTLLGYMFGQVKLTNGLFFVLKYFEYFVIYFMAVNYLTDKKQVERFVTVLMIVCFVTCIIAILQIPGGERVSAPFEGETGEPNTLGGYLVLMLALVLGLLATPQSTKRKRYLFVLTFLIVVSLLATLSRSSWLAAGFMLVAIVFYTKRKMTIVIPLLVGMMILAIAMPQTVKERASYTVTQRKHVGQIKIGGVRLDTSTSARLSSWKQVLTKDFVKHPFFGYGVTGYNFVDAQYPKVLIETGLLGFSAFLMLLFAIFKNARDAYNNTKDPFLNGIALGFIAGFIGMVVHAIGANTFIIVRIMEPFWFLTAIVVMMPAIDQGAVEQGPQVN